MPNPFSKLKIRNIIYDVKDAIARSSIGNLSELQTEHKDNLVDAINDAAQSGGGGGGASPYTQNPSSLGQANPGSVNQYARGDHVHPMPSASDVGALPDSTTIPTKTSQLQNDSGFLTSAPVSSVNGQTGAVMVSKGDVGLGNVDNVRQYSTNNPPPYPVTSVNGQTGAVTVSKGDVGLGNVDNVQQYSATNPPPYPVTSVNGQTGTVVLDADDVGAEPSVIEVTISTSGAVTQALDAGTIYHFTGNLTSLTVTASNATTGKYQFDFISGATVPTLTVPASWVMPDNFMVEPSARYSMTVENGYCSLKKWSDSHSPFIYLDSSAGDFIINTSGINSGGRAYANIGTEIVAVTIDVKLKNQLADNTWLKICDISASAKTLMGSTYVSSYISVGNGKITICAFNTWDTSSEIRIKNNTGAALDANTGLVGTIFILRTL